MTNLRLVDPMPKTLDRTKWHKPLVSIIVTHFNYTDHVMDCLLSIIDQTYENWECVVVDDVSDTGHVMALETIIHQIGHPRIKLHLLEDNVGQIPAFFAGLDQTKGEFVCALDPDDRYAQDFLAEMVAAHLNRVRFVPLISCEQHLMRDSEIITGVATGHAGKALTGDDLPGVHVAPDLRWFPAEIDKWHWSSTSGMMFRRPALKAMRPRRELGYKRQIDAYLAPGAHMLGGSMFLNKPLIYRSVHENNGWLREDVFGQSQAPKLTPMGSKCRADVREAIIANGYGMDLARAARGKRTLAQRLRRSIAKRWNRWLPGVAQ